MTGVIRKTVEFFLSLEAATWLISLLLLLFLAGAFSMPLKEEFGGINSGALLPWLWGNPPGLTWWLWASIAVLLLLAVNTAFCGVDSLVRKRRGRPWLAVLSPQVIHLGFMFMLLAHLVSSAWSGKGAVVAAEGMSIALPDELALRIGSIEIKQGPQGYPLDWRAEVEFYLGREKVKGDYLAPNRPAFYRGFGVYLKDVRLSPVRSALIEVTREPGAPWALVGGVLYTAGTVLLMGLKIAREK
jgi:hypothetical protein